MKTIKYYCLAIMVLASLTAFGQDMKQKIEMDIDSIGNAKITVSMDMNAAQWQTWIQTLGSNPAALKREVQRSMPDYFLDDFQLEKNDMERSFRLSLNAYGVCDVDKSGTWILDTDEKGVELTELGNGKYMYVNSPEEFAGQIQQTTLVSFPEAASGIKIDEDAFGKTLFEFDMEDQTSGVNWPRWIGIILLAIAIVWSTLKAIL